MKKYSQYFIKSSVLVTLLVLVGTQFSGNVFALTQAQIQAYQEGILYFDTEDYGTGCSANGTTSGSISASLPNNIPAIYATLFTAASAAYKINPNFLAALYMSENGNVWKPFDTQWPDGPSGDGPFQFEPATWAAYQVDGNNDGIKDINNMYDAAYSAANLLSANGDKVDTPLGNLTTPFVPNTILYIAAAYNEGGGRLQEQTTPSSPITAVYEITQNYVKNVYTLITSGFTKSGNPNYGNPSDQTNGETAPTNGSGGAATDAGAGCSGSVVAGSIVQTAIALAWPSGGHGPNTSDATAAYQAAEQQYNGASDAYADSDCDVFVSTVMIGSGADPDFPKRSTIVEEQYLNSSPKYTKVNASSTADLKPGDIFVNSAHTYLYIGPQAGGLSVAEASYTQNVPEVNANPYFSQSDGGQFEIFRLNSN